MQQLRLIPRGLHSSISGVFAFSSLGFAVLADSTRSQARAYTELKCRFSVLTLPAGPSGGVLGGGRFHL